MKETDGITAGELLDLTNRILCEVNARKEINFPVEISVVCVDDSDMHRSRQGRMGYKKVNIITYGMKTFAAGLGRSMGAYPSKNYTSDLIIIDITDLGEMPDNELSNEIQKRIKSGDNFRNSVLIARSNGQLSFSKNRQNRFKKKIVKALRPIAAGYVAQPMIESKEALNAFNLEAMVISPVRYQSEFSVEIAKQISEMLYKL